VRPRAWRPRSGASLGACVALLVAAGASGCSSNPVTCQTGQTACGSTCVDLNTDPGHCGACNISCIALAQCVAANCECPTGLTKCSGLSKCVDLTADPGNCGTCGHACGLGTCSSSVCACNPTPPTVVLCPVGSTGSTGTCVDIATNPANCGGCGATCGTGFACSSSACTCGTGNQACVTGTPATCICGTGASAVCTNTNTDAKNCGGCGNACATGLVCASGQCGCSGSLTLCSGKCVDTGTDPANCGACGRTCSSSQSCSGGSCTTTCTGLTCGGQCCSGPACCGSSGSQTCQYTHNNGVGQTFYDCIPVGDYSQPLATDAANAWSTTGSDTFTVCPGCLARQVPSLNGGLGACGIWCYDSSGVSIPGTVNVVQTQICLSSYCPGSSSSTWQ